MANPRIPSMLLRGVMILAVLVVILFLKVWKLESDIRVLAQTGLAVNGIVEENAARLAAVQKRVEKATP